MTVLEREAWPGGRAGRLVRLVDELEGRGYRTLTQTGPMRPATLHPGLSNVVFTGSGTQPGVGVPMVLISGQLAAARITGG